MNVLLGIPYLLAILFPFTLCKNCTYEYGSYDDASYRKYTRDERIFPNSQKYSDEETRISEKGECPEEYLRYSPDPTYCKTSTCDIIAEGVNEEDKKLILEIHNNFRSKLASGNELRYRQLPPAADMMELEWDDELAKIAQAHASLCVFKHDEYSQRRVDDFPVGQNLLMSSTDRKRLSSLSSWYKEEVCFYLPEYNKPFSLVDYFGHFTQMTWAKTWKVGCGYAAFRENGESHSLYTCNYGPAGNIKETTFYTEGEPCSQCPLNTKCSKEYSGLCKSQTEDGPQPKRPSSDDFIFFCDFSEQDPERCKEVKVTGSRNFSTKHIYSGDYKTVVLQAGESIIIDFGKVYNSEGFCPFVYTRFGSNRANDSAGSVVEFNIGRYRIPYRPPREPVFTFMAAHMIANLELQCKVILRVDEDAAPQYFDIKAWGISKGDCINAFKD
uniref:Venom toxin n=1 Tax=Hemiscorpius lepturus TaxID=520031 RepID=A0A1L4BJ76_HEMLE|nr:venom toxin [Hemiscorpius lepturus]